MTNIFVRELDLALGLNTTDGRPSTPHWCRLCAPMALLAFVQPRHQVRLWQMRNLERRPPIPSSLARVPEPSWSSWLQKSADVGLRRRFSARDYASVGGSRLAPSEKDSSLLEHRSPVSVAGDILARGF